MSWRDRAIADDSGNADSAATPAGAVAPTPSWRDRAVAVPQDNYWGDVGKSAGNEVRNMPGIMQTGMALAQGTPLGETPLGQMGKQAYKIGRGMFGGPVESGMQMAQGKPFSQTPVGQSVQGIGDLVKGSGQQLWGIAKDVGGALGSVPQVLKDTPISQTYAGQALRQRPLSFAGNLAMVAAPMAERLFRSPGMAPETPEIATGEIAPPNEAQGGKPPPSNFESPLTPPSIKTPNYLETQGGRGLYSTTGIRGLTVQKLAGRGQNPGSVGTNLIKEISDAGGIGHTSAETWDKIDALKDAAGREVGNALDAISKQSEKYGVVENPLEMSADKALKPIYDAWAKHAGGLTSPSANLAREFENVHTGLSQIAQRQGGIISLDNIKQALDEVGPLTHKGSEETQAAMAELYGTLADTHDAMIEKIAQEAKNPSLASNLLKANKKYSRYARIMPDVSRASVMESVGQPNLGGLIDHFKQAVLRSPTVQRGVMDAGGLFNKDQTPTPTPTPLKVVTPAEMPPSVENQGFVQKKLKTQSGSIFPKSPDKPGFIKNKLTSEKGSIFPTPETKPLMRDLPDSEQVYQSYKQAYDRHMDNYDFQNALKDKWGMHRNTGGN